MRDRNQSAAWFAIVLLAATLVVGAYSAWPVVERFFGWNESLCVWGTF